MKLRAYTPEETDELLEQIKFLGKYIVDINADAISVFEEKYKEYLAAFKPGIIFKRKPLSHDKFISKCFYNESHCIKFYDAEYSYWSRFKFFQDVFPVSFTYCRFDPKLKYFDNHFIKYGVPSWTKEETEILNRAAGSTYYFFEKYTFREWYAILVKYAHRPFEFDKSDIEVLEVLERSIDSANKYYEGNK